MPKHVLVPIADGTEDIELSCITDILRRADIQVTVSSIMKEKKVTLSRGLVLLADSVITEESADKFDAVLLPGGLPGADHLGANEPLKKILSEIRASGKLYGAICASPVRALLPLGALEGVKAATCYPALKDTMPSHITWSPDCVVRCGNCLTSKGPGTAMAFPIAAVSILVGAEKAKSLATDLLIDSTPDIQFVLNKF